VKFAKGWGRNFWVNYSGKVDVLKGNRKKLSFSHLEERFNIIQNLLQIFYIILGIKYITLHFASSIPTVAKLTFQLARCGCTLRVTSQTPYSPTHRENNQQNRYAYRHLGYACTHRRICATLQPG
jgi:hypothetical protein